MSASNQIGQTPSPRCLALLVSFSLVLLSACSAPSPGRYQQGTSGVAVVGVTARSGIKTAINRHSLAREFAQMLADRQQFQVIPASVIRQSIGATQVNEMMDRYARRGQLAQRDIQFLMGAGLTSRYAVVARLENDQIRSLPERREALVGSNGDRLMDRQRSIVARQRITQVSAILFDLRTGRELWNKHYRVDPISEVVLTTYHGSSFSSSLAAAFTNTVVNGISVSRQPEVPPLKESLRSLLGEIANRLPVK